MLRKHWSSPPVDVDMMFQWKVYCRIWNDVGLAAPGTWILMWMNNGFDEEPHEMGSDWDHYCMCREAIRYYVAECRE